MFSRVKVSLLLLIFIFLILPGCKHNEDIKIGLSATLTGKHSSLGLAVRDGVQLAVEEINDAGGVKGRKIQMLIKDDENDPEKAIVNDREFIQKGAVAIIGHVTSGMTQAVLPLMNENEMLLISPTVSSNKFSKLDDNLICIHPSSRLEQDKLCDYAFNKLGLGRLTVIYDISNEAFSTDWCDYFTTQFQELGGEIVDRIPFDSSNLNLDYIERAKKILSSNPEGVLIVASAIDTAMICQQLEKQGSDIHIISSGWALGDTLLQHGGPAVEGVILPSFWDKYSRNEAYITFKENFFKRYKRNPGFAESYGYETMMVLHKALLKADKITPISIKNIILKIEEFKGLQGKIKIDSSGDTSREVYLFQVKNNQFKRIDF